MVRYKKKTKKKTNCSVLADLFISSVRLSSLLCGWLPTECVCWTVPFLCVTYMGEKGLGRVWNVCFLAMATIERNAWLWEKTGLTVKESTVVPKYFFFKKKKRKKFRATHPHRIITLPVFVGLMTLSSAGLQPGEICFSTWCCFIVCLREKGGGNSHFCTPASPSVSH